MSVIKKLLFLAPLMAATVVNTVEFEIMDRFSVNNYSEFRGFASVVTDDLSSSGIL